MPTIGEVRRMAPADPRKRASPKAKIPPSEETSQYPLPVGVGAISTIGVLRSKEAVDPNDVAAPNGRTSSPRSDACPAAVAGAAGARTSSAINEAKAAKRLRRNIPNPLGRGPPTRRSIEESPFARARRRLDREQEGASADLR